MTIDEVADAIRSAHALGDRTVHCPYCFGECWRDVRPQGGWSPSICCTCGAQEMHDTYDDRGFSDVDEMRTGWWKGRRYR